MKRCEMHRHGIAEVANDPLAKPLGFIGIVVFAGDHQIGDLESPEEE